MVNDKFKKNAKKIERCLSYNRISLAKIYLNELFNTISSKEDFQSCIGDYLNLKERCTVAMKKLKWK